MNFVNFVINYGATDSTTTISSNNNISSSNAPAGSCGIVGKRKLLYSTLYLLLYEAIVIMFSKATVFYNGHNFIQIK